MYPIFHQRQCVLTRETQWWLGSSVVFCFVATCLKKKKSEKKMHEISAIYATCRETADDLVGLILIYVHSLRKHVHTLNDNSIMGKEMSYCVDWELVLKLHKVILLFYCLLVTKRCKHDCPRSKLLPSAPICLNQGSTIVDFLWRD